MNALVAVTDYEWFRFLKGCGALDEVNFWQPSGNVSFRALAVGEPLLFKLHAPRNFVVGGGFFRHFSVLPFRMAWDFFGEKNGAASLREMRQRIERYRKVPGSPGADYSIGCILLNGVFYFDEADWIPVPNDWSPNIVRYKAYDLTKDTGLALWHEVQVRLEGTVVAEKPAARDLFGDPILVRPRMGQGTFRALVTDAYQRRCAVTGERALPVLEAAHILPVSEGGPHELQNGLLLRSDLHRLYDRGYLTVTPDYRCRVSRRLKDDFDNGEPYYPLDGSQIWRPNDPGDWPSRERLEWHADTLFRG